MSSMSTVTMEASEAPCFPHESFLSPDPPLKNTDTTDKRRKKIINHKSPSPSPSPGPERRRGDGDGIHVDIGARLREYIGCLNTAAFDAIGAHLADTIHRNGHAQTRDEHVGRLRSRVDGLDGLNVRIDTMLVDRAARAVAARYINRITLPREPMLYADDADADADAQNAEEEDGNNNNSSSSSSNNNNNNNSSSSSSGGGRSTDRKRTFEFDEQCFTWFDDDGKIARMLTLQDNDGIRRQDPTAPTTPRFLVRSTPERPVDLRALYGSYVDCINLGSDSDMAAELPRYCAGGGVRHNGRALSLDEYRRGIERSREAVAGLRFEVRELLVDEDTQQVAARLEISGTPVLEFAGARPSGAAVRFCEHCMYRLDRGKIAVVWATMELDACRRQMEEKMRRRGTGKSSSLGID